MRNFFKAAPRKQNFQHSLRIESLETRNLLTMTLPHDSGDFGVGHYPPAGMDKMITMLSETPYTFSSSDFGFSDPADNNAFTSVLVDTLPASGILLLADSPVSTGQFVTVDDLAAGKLKYLSAGSASAHPSMTFQVEDNGSTDPAFNLDPTPNTITFNTSPIAQDDTYMVKEGETLDQRLLIRQVHIVSQPGDPMGAGQTFDFDNTTHIFSVTRDDQNILQFNVNPISVPQPEPGQIVVNTGPLLIFGAANGDVLATGTYSDAVRYPRLDASKPEIYVSPYGYFYVINNSSPSSPSNQFTINQIQYSETGEVLKFDATFEQHYPDNSAGMTGWLKYDIPNAQSVSVLQNDLDAEGDPLTAILVAGPQHGIVKLNSDGGFVYTPEAGFTGIDTFRYKANDGAADSNVATVSINVIPYSHAPMGTSSTVSVPVGPYYTLKTSDFGFTDPKDTPADTFTRVKITTLPATASLTLSGITVTEGDFISVDDIAAGNLVLTPATGIPHISFTFQVEDSGSTENDGEILDPAPKTLTFNAPPVAVDDAYSVDENQTLQQADLGNHWEITVGGAFYDASAQKIYNYDGSNGQCTVTQDGNTLEFRYPWGGIFGNPAIRFAAAGGAQLVPGVYTNAKEFADAYSPGLAMNWGGGGTPNPYVTGEFTVLEAVYDNSGNILQFDAIYQQVNQNYQYTHTGRFQYHASAKPSVSILQNDSDADGDPLSIILVSQPSHGSMIFDHDGGFIYTPSQYYYGPDSFQYKLNDGIADGNVATVTIDVAHAHQAPEGTSGVVKMEAGVPCTLKPADFGFTDPNDAVADTFAGILVTSVPSSGVLEFDGMVLSAGNFIVSADDIAAGKLNFTCDPGLPHPVLYFQVQDDGSTDNGGANLDPTPNTLLFDIAPVAQDDAYTVNENGVLDQSMYLTRLTMSSEPGDYVGQGRNYNILSCFATRNNDNGIWILAEGWSLNFSAPGNVPLVPGVYTGAERYPFQGGSPGLDIHGEGRGSNTLTGQFTVLEAVYGPSGEVLKFDATFEQHSEGMTPALTGRIQYHASSLNAISVLANDSDADGEALSMLLMTRPQHGWLSVNSDGGFIYTPYPYFSGFDSFQYFAYDGFAASNLATVTITVNHVSQAPAGTSGTVNIPSGEAYVLKAEDFGFTDPYDTPADNFAGVKITTLPTRGTMMHDKVPVVAGQFVSAADIAAGKLTFMPPAYGSGSGRASFGFQVEDSGSTDNGGAILDAEPKTLILNSTPVAFNDTYRIENKSLVLNVQANDRDTDNDFCSMQILENPSHGTIYFLNGNYVYHPYSEFYGTDTFQYRINDGTADSNVAIVTINVVPSVFVKILPAPTQLSIATDSPIHFIADFAEPVVDFTADDLILYSNGTRGTLTASITPLGTDGRIYDIAVTGMQISGEISVSLPGGTVHTVDGISNVDAWSVDHPVDYLANGITISGTVGDDTFVFQAGDSPATWKVTVNGQTKVIPANISNLLIDGVSGSDTLSFFGNNQALSAYLAYNQGSIYFGNYSFLYENMDHTTVVGGSGHDVATLQDSAGNDTFESLPGSAKLSTAGESLTLKNIDSVTVQGSTGNDTAVMYGSLSADNTFVADPNGAGFFYNQSANQVNGFKTVSAYAGPGRNNIAEFRNTDGHNLLIASYLGAQYFGQGFAYDVWNLTTINGHGGEGDEARFYGSPGADTALTVSPTAATQTEPNLTLQGTGYRTFSSYVSPLGNTSATITGEFLAPHAVTSPLGAQLFSKDYALSAWTYRHISVISNIEGNCGMADMYASSGADSFTGAGSVATLASGAVDRKVMNFSSVTAHGNATSTATFFAERGKTNTFDAGQQQSSMYTEYYANVARGFGTNTGYALPGNGDVATFDDSAGTDYFISSYLGAQMFGTGYNNSAWNFASMTATSSGGADTARFYGSPSNPDSFVANPTDAKHSGTGYQSEAKNFARVEAYSGLGSGGTAQLTGSSGDDHFVSSPQGAQLWNQNYRIEAWNYASVKTEGAGGNDKADMYGTASDNQLAADNVFAQLSGDEFSNRIEHFLTANVHGSTGDKDGVMLHDAYLLKGIKDQPNDAEGHVITQKLWLYDFDWATISHKNVIGLPAPWAIDKVMTAFMYE